MGKLFLVLLFSCVAFGLTDVDRQELVHKNILAPYNAGFESGKANWTASGGTFLSVISGTNLMLGKGSATWDSSAAGQTWRSKLVTIPKGLYGANGMIRCKVQTPSGTATHKIQVYDGTNVVGENTLVSSTLPLNQTVNFIFPSSGSLQIQMTSVAADEPLIAADDCYIGGASNLSEVSQAGFVGKSYFAAGSCNWTRTSTTLGAFGTVAACPGPVIEAQKIGTWLTTDTDLPKQTIENLPPGIYVVTFTGLSYVTGGVGVTAYTISDGSTTSGLGFGTYYTTENSQTTIVGVFEYSSTGTRTFEVYGAATTNTVNLEAASTGRRAEFTITRFPLTSQTVYTPDTFSSAWAGYHAYSASCLWSRTNTAFGDFTGDADCNLVETINQNFGNVSSYGGATEQPGFLFTPLRSGLYEVCAEGQFYNSASSFSALRLTSDGSTQIAAQAFDMIIGTISPFKLCGFHRVSSTAQVSIRLEGKSSTGTLNILGSAGAGQNVIEWTIKQIEQAVPIPIYAGSSISGIEYVCNSGMTDVNDTTSFVTSENGCDWPQTTYTADRSKRIRWANAPKSTDTIQFQTRTSATESPWTTIDSSSVGISMIYSIQNGVGYGAGRVLPIGSPATDFDVLFGQYRYNTGATYGAAGTNWAAGMAGFKWRVVKYSNAIPVDRVEPAYQEVVLTADTSTVSTDTYVDIAGSSISITPGTWDIGADLSLGVFYVTAGCAGTVVITDSSNNIMGNAVRDLAMIPTSSVSYIWPVSLTARNIQVSSTTTYKARIRASAAAANCYMTALGAANQHGGLTDPDTKGIVWARRIK